MIKYWGEKDEATGYTAKDIAVKMTTSLFLRKLVLKYSVLAGLLTFLIFSSLPIGHTDSGYLELLKTPCKFMHQDYSYGDSSGFAPDSLLMKHQKCFINQKSVVK